MTDQDIDTDMGYMINHAMFQRNGRAGYILKPPALRLADKHLLSKRTKHFLGLRIISAQQLPRPKDSQGREIFDKSTLDPFVEVSLYVPEWTQSPTLLTPSAPSRGHGDPAYSAPANASTSSRTVSLRTSPVRNNGFNPVWEEHLRIPFELVGDMLDLVFVRFAVKRDGADIDEPLAVYCASLGSLKMGESPRSRPLNLACD